jgi:hypothetical protein
MEAVSQWEALIKCFDGRYRYICEAGHTTVTDEPIYDACTALLPWSASAVTGVPCGAPTEARIIPYERAEGS